MFFFIESFFMFDVLVPAQAVPSLLGRYMRDCVCQSLTFSQKKYSSFFPVNRGIFFFFMSAVCWLILVKDLFSVGIKVGLDYGRGASN